MKLECRDPRVFDAANAKAKGRVQKNSKRYRCITPRSSRTHSGSRMIGRLFTRGSKLWAMVWGRTREKEKGVSENGSKFKFTKAAFVFESPGNFRIVSVETQGFGVSQLGSVSHVVKGWYCERHYNVDDNCRSSLRHAGPEIQRENHAYDSKQRFCPPEPSSFTSTTSTYRQNSDIHQGRP